MSGSGPREDGCTCGPALVETHLAGCPVVGFGIDIEPYDEADDMCPNCQTPWKCNGPHLYEQTPRNLRLSERGS